MELKGCPFDSYEPVVTYEDYEEKVVEEDVLHDDLLLDEKDDVRLDENVTEVKADSVSDTLLESQYMGVAVGVLVTVILLLIVVIVFILYRNYLGPDNNTAVYSNNHNIRKNV